MADDRLLARLQLDHAVSEREALEERQQRGTHRVEVPGTAHMLHDGDAYLGQPRGGVGVDAREQALR
jgi:hypothetical protein